LRKRREDRDKGKGERGKGRIPKHISGLTDLGV
jgi:hypothetical protein